MDAKELHDQLIASKPEGANHDSSTCPLCKVAPVTAASAVNPSGGGPAVDEKTFTETELKAAVDKAIAEAITPLEAELTTFRQGQMSADVEQKIAEAKAPLETQIADLQSQLDEKVIEAQTASSELASLKTFLDDAAAAEAAQAEVAARVEARKSEVAEVVEFPEEYITANAERWAGMDDEGFATYIDGLKVTAEKAGTAKVPTGTALTASREGSRQTTGNGKVVASGLAAIREMRSVGADPRTL